MPHTDRMAAEKVFENMKKRGISKVALLSESSGFGNSGKKETEGVAAKYGITLVATKGYVGTGGVVNLSAFRMLEIKGGDWTLAR